MSNRPSHVVAPDYLSPSKPVPTPEPIPGPEDTVEHGGPKGLEPTRYNDWENKGIAWDF